MRVTVGLCAVLRHSHQTHDRRSTRGEFEIEVAEDMTLRDAVRTLDLPAGVESITCVNGRPSPEDTPLADGDHLYVFVPVSGG